MPSTRNALRHIAANFALATFAVLLIANSGCDSADTSEPGAKDSPTPAVSSESPIEMATRLHQTMGCAVCHSLDGTKRTAGTYKGIYGTQVELTDGRVVTRDDGYLRRAIVEPDSDVVKGYSPIMQSYAETLSAAEIDAFIALIKSIGPDPAGAPQPADAEVTAP